MSSVISFANSVSTPIALTDGFVSLTTNFMNLLPGTTYYFRIRAANGDGIASAFSLVGTTQTLNAPSPTNLVGVALGVSSISWTWSTVTGAQSYNLYYATGTLDIAGISGTSVNEINLSTNVAYGRQVTAVVNGIESPLSAATTVYTLAATPTIAVFSGVSNNQFTITWNPTGDPAGTRFEVSRSTDNFVLDISTPIQISNNFTNTTTTFFTLSLRHDVLSAHPRRQRQRNSDGFPRSCQHTDAVRSA